MTNAKPAKLPGKFYRSKTGVVHRPTRCNTAEARAIAEKHGTHQVYRSRFYLRNPQSAKPWVLVGRSYWTHEELLAIPKSRWTKKLPRKLPGVEAIGGLSRQVSGF
jgi:hypothetical protein